MRETRLAFGSQSGFTLERNVRNFRPVIRVDRIYSRDTENTRLPPPRRHVAREIHYSERTPLRLQISNERGGSLWGPAPAMPADRHGQSLRPQATVSSPPQTRRSNARRSAACALAGPAAVRPPAPSREKDRKPYATLLVVVTRQYQYITIS